MKTISLWQPWASLVALGQKTIETRCWSTNYRGPLAIHAATTTPKWAMQAFYAINRDELQLWRRDFPGGVVIATCELVDVIPTEKFTPPVDQLTLGDFGPRRFAWILSNIKAIPPIPARGRQRFFEVELPACVS